MVKNAPSLRGGDGEKCATPTPRPTSAVRAADQAGLACTPLELLSAHPPPGSGTCSRAERPGDQAGGWGSPAKLAPNPGPRTRYHRPSAATAAVPVMMAVSMTVTMVSPAVPVMMLMRRSTA